jgi:dual 3',5'-cyclic-AMP and -GMP phosphodiesterase 11
MSNVDLISAAFFGCGIYLHLTRKRIAEERRRNVKLLQAISDIGSARSTKSAKQILEVVVNSVTTLLDCEKTSIYFCNSVHKEVFIVSKQRDNLDEGLTLAYGQGIAGKCAETCTTQRVGDTTTNTSFFGAVDSMTGFKSKTMLCVPVFDLQDAHGEKKALAVIQAINKKGQNDFSQEDETALNYIVQEFYLALKTKARDYYEISKFGRHKEIDASLAESLLLEYGTDKIQEKKYRVVRDMNFNTMLGVKHAASVWKHKADIHVSSHHANDAKLEHEIMEYSYNPFAVSNHHLIDLAMQMILHYNLVHDLNLNIDLVKRFIIKVESMYNNPAFHNFKHGWGVMHTVFLILKLGGDKFLSSLEIFAMLISAICHDIGHPGNTNVFEVASRSERAIAYCDDSVLERFHASTTVRLLSEPEYDIVAHFTPDDKKYFRQTVISNILMTDMFHHFECVKKLETMKDSFDFHKVSDRKFLMGSIVHSADIGAQTQDLAISLLWTDCICEEFTDQVAQEAKLGLPISAYMAGLDDENKKNKLQAQFVGDMVLPLWEALTSILPELKPHTTKCRECRDYFMAKLPAPASK